jgi:hypothetical protein
MIGQNDPQRVVRIDAAIKPHEGGGFSPAIYHYRADGSWVEHVADIPAVPLGTAVLEANAWAARERIKHALAGKTDQ